MINEAVLEITAPRVTCFKLGVRMGCSTFVKQFVKSCRPGVYARVIQEGEVKAGISITVTKTEKAHASVSEVFTLWHSKENPVP